MRVVELVVEPAGGRTGGRTVVELLVVERWSN